LQLALRRFVLRPMLEILEMVEPVTAPLRRHPALLLLLGLLSLWLGWPSLAPALRPLLGARGGIGSRVPPPEVISVFVEAPTRSIWALNLWKNKPGALLVMQGRPSSQIANMQYLRSQGRWPENAKRLVTLQPGCDTVGQVAALARLLEQQRAPGRVTLVTSNAHLPRTLAIAHTVIGPMGWQVDGLPVVTEDNRPEDPIRLWRDQLRAQMLRFTGITGTRSDELCE